MTPYLGLIDPPNEFSSSQQWSGFLDRMKTKWPQDEPLVQEMINRAEAELTARRLAGDPDQPLSAKAATKFWALARGPDILFPANEQRRALASLKDPRIYPQDNPAVRKATDQVELALTLPRDEKGWVILDKVDWDQRHERNNQQAAAD